MSSELLLDAAGSAALPRGDARPQRRASAKEQRPRVSGRPADGR